MKELSIEQKAKAYDNVVGKLKQFMEQGVDPLITRVDVKDFFPELKESDDERIRKRILLSLEKDLMTTKNSGCNTQDLEQCIAWLEKQGEPQDKGEISDGYHTFNELYYYRMLYNAAFFNMLPKEWVHKSKKHNDGEECFGGGWFIVMANLPTGQVSNHYELKDWDLFQIPEKEVADEWDGHTPQEAADRLHKYLLEKQGEQKPAEWSEEDEDNYKCILEILQDCHAYGRYDLRMDEHAALKNWLKSLKGRVQPQTKQEWSEEDERERKRVVCLLEGWLSTFKETSYAEDCNRGIDWLKSLRPYKQ